MDNKKKKLISTIIVIILVLAMIIPTVAGALTMFAWVRKDLTDVWLGILGKENVEGLWKKHI